MSINPLSLLDPETRALLEKYAAQVPEIAKALGERALGFGEAATTVGSGLVGAIPAGLQGMASLMTTGSLDKAADATRATQEALTYMPRMDAGKEYVGAVGTGFEKAAEAINSAPKQFLRGGLDLQSQRSPAGQQALEEAPPMSELALKYLGPEAAALGYTALNFIGPEHMSPEMLLAGIPLVKPSRIRLAAEEAKAAAEAARFDMSVPKELPEDVLNAFITMGENQRGAPEAAMLGVQKAHSGVLSGVVEHTGDLTHRMTHMMKYGPGNTGREYVLDKTDKVLRTLNRDYPFKKEHGENLTENAKYYERDPETHNMMVDTLLSNYAEGHAGLPVYNLPQALARDAAVSIGKKDWDTARDRLQRLHDLAADPEAFDWAATRFGRSDIVGGSGRELFHDGMAGGNPLDATTSSIFLGDERFDPQTLRQAREGAMPDAIHRGRVLAVYEPGMERLDIRVNEKNGIGAHTIGVIDALPGEEIPDTFTGGHFEGQKVSDVIGRDAFSKIRAGFEKTLPDRYDTHVPWDSGDKDVPLLKPFPRTPAEAEKARAAAAAAPTPKGEDVFHSELDNAVDRLPNQGTRAQMYNTLQNTPGVKLDEIKDRGLARILASEPDKPITKAEIEAHLANNPLQIERDVLGGKGSQPVQTGIEFGEPDDMWHNLQRDTGAIPAHIHDAHKAGVIPMLDKGALRGEIMSEVDDRFNAGAGTTAEESASEADKIVNSYSASGPASLDATHHLPFRIGIDAMDDPVTLDLLYNANTGQYQIRRRGLSEATGWPHPVLSEGWFERHHGGPLALDEAKSLIEGDKDTIANEVMYQDNVERPSDYEPPYENYTTPGGENYRVVQYHTPTAEGEKDWLGSHFSTEGPENVPNVFGHALVKDRTVEATGVSGGDLTGFMAYKVKVDNDGNTNFKLYLGNESDAYGTYLGEFTNPGDFATAKLSGGLLNGKTVGETFGQEAANEIGTGYKYGKGAKWQGEELHKYANAPAPSGAVDHKVWAEVRLDANDNQWLKFYAKPLTGGKGGSRVFLGAIDMDSGGVDQLMTGGKYQDRKISDIIGKDNVATLDKMLEETGEDRTKFTISGVHSLGIDSAPKSGDYRVQITLDESGVDHGGYDIGEWALHVIDSDGNKTYMGRLPPDERVHEGKLVDGPFKGKTIGEVVGDDMLGRLTKTVEDGLYPESAYTITSRKTVKLDIPGAVKPETAAKRYLDIDELQSDLHQKGRDYGYAESDLPKTASHEEVAAAAKIYDDADLAARDVGNGLYSTLTEDYGFDIPKGSAHTKDYALLERSERLAEQSNDPALAAKVAEFKANIAAKEEALRAYRRTQNRMVPAPLIDGLTNAEIAVDVANQKTDLMARDITDALGLEEGRHGLDHVTPTGVHKQVLKMLNRSDHTPEQGVMLWRFANDLGRAIDDANKAEAAATRADKEITKYRRRVPDLPFKKNWDEVMMKDLMRQAAEQGYDGIMWSDGMDIADRYSDELRGAMDSIFYVTESGRVNFYSTPKGTNKPRLLGGIPVPEEGLGAVDLSDDVTGGLIERSRRDEKDLKPYVGSEVLKQMAEALKEGKKDLTIEGDNLTIGYGGHIYQYNKRNVQIAEKEAKKHGIRAKKVPIKAGSKTYNKWALDYTDDLRKDLTGKTYRGYSKGGRVRI